ncbi:calpain-9-like isoform X1 [Daphnia carinata]|uniref:calpain-9-like isoform X1 n=1 Tax=Daphnia carinata TaxID=120202 RepID=UPI00257C4BE0|nr:calpain-9-like isoform X1 [Daphnia carinata]
MRFVDNLLVNQIRPLFTAPTYCLVPRLFLRLHPARRAMPHKWRSAPIADGAVHRQQHQPAPPPPPQWANNGWPPPREDKQSTLSRYWTNEKTAKDQGRGGLASGAVGGTSVGGARHLPSNYHQLKRVCRDRGLLFDDPDFPSTTRSLYANKKPANLGGPITWLRPHDICQRPTFIANGASRFDVEQGELGDPWLLAAISSLTLTPRFLDRVVPPDQTFDLHYCGLFRFRFWHFGDWVEVVIDDKLPTVRGKLVYLHSSDPQEFWAALLEKAYAKLYGNYENLHAGFTTKALQDLTGGIVQSFCLSQQDKFLTYQVLNSAVPRSTLLIASISFGEKEASSGKQPRALRLRNGLMSQTAYSVTGLARVRSSSRGEVPLVRLRNPWGRGEWSGPWSERSWEWDSLSERDKELLSVRVRNEGEFWMSFEDFSKQFTHLDLVHIGPDDWMNEPALHSKKPWRAVLARRRWRAGYNAGGGPHYLETTAMNPQFFVQIPRTAATSSKCHVVVSVTQHYETRDGLHLLGKQKKMGAAGCASGGGSGAGSAINRAMHAIGFAVYEVPPNVNRLTAHFVAEHKPLDVTNHSVAREVVTFFTLPPGDYVVVPQTGVAHCEGKFLLRIFTDEHSNIWEVNEDNMIFRNVAAEGFEDGFKHPEVRSTFNKLAIKYPTEIDAAILMKILKQYNCFRWSGNNADLVRPVSVSSNVGSPSGCCSNVPCFNSLMGSEKPPSLELCKSLIMLRDFNISGKINLIDVPALLHTLHFWRVAFSKYDRAHGGKTSSYNLRPILWESGLTVSNKVLECLVLRFAKNRVLTAEAFVMALVRLHLAHERYLSIDSKMKGSPLSLEEMILMTIYS